MYYDKGKYEKLIQESPLFEIDRESEPSRYDREKYRLIENLYLYLMAVNEKKFEPYSVEIMNVADNCIRAFDATKGEFLHYFNAAWKMEQKHIFGDEDLEAQYHGLKIKESDIRKIRQIKRLIDEMNLDATSKDMIKKISDVLQMSTSDVKTYFEMLSATVSDGYIIDSDGDEYSVIDQIADATDVEDEITGNERIKYLLKTIQRVYEKQQKRSQPIISDYLTTSIYPTIKGFGITQHYSFISDFAVFAFEKKNRVLTKREIAIRYNRNEASINRTIKKYLAELDEAIKGDNN